jgi:hypothetical protein
MAQIAPAPDEEQLRAHFDGLVRRGAFRRGVARFLPESILDERMQDAIAQTWETYVRYAGRGRILEDALLVHHARIRAVDPSRYFVKCEGQQRLRDAMDFRNYANGRVEILHLDGLPEDESDYGDGDPQLHGLASALSIAPARNLASAVDLEAWLDQLDESDRNLLAAKASGFTLDETATDAGVSTSTVFNRTKQLGEELAARVGVDLTATERRRERRGEPLRRRGRPKATTMAAAEARP